MKETKKVLSSSTPKFLETGGNKMNRGTAAGPQVAFGTGAVKTSGSGGKFPQGGSGKMFGKQSAGPARGGMSGKKG